MAVGWKCRAHLGGRGVRVIFDDFDEGVSEHENRGCNRNAA